MLALNLSMPDGMRQHYHRLAQTAMRLASGEGRHESHVPGLSVYRHNRPENAMPCIYPQGIVLSLQGCKEVRYGEHSHWYQVGDVLFVGVGLSAFSYVTDCSAEQPYLGLALELDWAQLAEAAAHLPAPEIRSRAAVFPLMRMPADEGLLGAVGRLLALMDEPMLCPHLAPLIQAEVAYRLLTGSQGPMLRQMLAAHSPVQQIGRATAWLKTHHAEKIAMAELAAMVHMSESSFRQHFRRITGVSPLQYQKQLRLQQARQLMLSEQLTAAEAALRVGYESPNQFSREYRRFFGQPPASDVEQSRRR